MTVQALACLILKGNYIPMNVTFTRGEARNYTTTALRDDGVLLQVPGSDRKFALPHDLAHYIVERELGLHRGFWGRIAAGAVYPGMKVLAGRQPVHAAERSRSVIREAAQQGVEAEVWVGVFLRVMQEGLEPNGTAVRAALSAEWRPSRPERNLPDAAEIGRICSALREAAQRWQALAAGQALTFTWPLDRRARCRSGRVTSVVPDGNQFGRCRDQSG
jgi:hypothetical protein